MLRQLAPWILIMIISTILSDVFGLCTQLINFWYLSICVSLYAIIYNGSIWSKNSEKNEINLSNENYDFDYIMQYVIIFFAIMLVTFIISYILGIDFFVAHAFVYLGEILNYNPLEIQS